jgi:hypothetical protein
LLEGDVDESPARLSDVPYFSLGSKIYGQGFLFDDEDPEATPNAVRMNISHTDPASASRILPYIGGEDINSSPVQAAPRYVIFLSDLKSEEDLSQYPLLEQIVRSKVKPGRDILGNNPNNTPLKKSWWAYQAHRPELYGRIKRKVRVIANSQVSGHLAFAFLPTNYIYSQTVNVIDIDSDTGFAILQSRVHETWARFMGSSMKDDLRYTCSDCFETFPFPVGYESNVALEQTGNAYYNFRADLMVRNNEGLTKTYNRFHDPNEDSPDIVRLRELHAAMDRAVLDVYGWHNIQPTCEFVPEFDDEEDEDDNGRPKKKKYRCKWPESLHDQVLAGLLELNRQRAEEQRRAAELQELSWDNGAIEPTAKPKRARGKNGAKSDTIAKKPTLFNAEEQEV